MAWIEFHDDVWEHHKTERLADILGLPVTYTVGHMASLWHFVLRNAWRDANLEPWGDRGIERAARWIGEPGVFVKAARDSGIIDGFVVHGWAERAGRLVGERLKNDTLRKSYVKRKKTVSKHEATLPNPTVPNPTVPNPTNRYSIPPSLDAVKVYCLERSSCVDPQQFLDYNEARGWMMGKSKMKDWQATIRTWEKNQNGNTGRNGQKRVVGAAAVTPGKFDAIDNKQ